jgi:hypothetical protein
MTPATEAFDSALAAFAGPTPMRWQRRRPISTLGDVHADNREGLDDQAPQATVVGTVDMIGSSLLFEGCGVSRRVRPDRPGLLGVNSRGTGPMCVA